MSDIKHRSGEKGIALVIALLLTALIGLMAAALSYTMASYLTSLAKVREKTQSYYLAYAGMEEMRNYLWNANCAPPLWCGILASKQTDSTYQDRTNLMVLNSSLNTEIQTSGTWSLFVKDNNDGDSNYMSDNDGIILSSVTAKDKNNATTSTLEAMFIFKANNNIYTQLGGGPDKSNNTPQSGSGTNSGNVVQSVSVF